MTTNKMWGGRFKSGPAAIMEAINVSIDIDKRLAVHDLLVRPRHEGGDERRPPPQRRPPSSTSCN